MKKSANTNSRPHQGKLLKELYNWSGLKSVGDFSLKFDRSRVWTTKAFKDEIIPKKDQYIIARAFNVPVEYFTGEFLLPPSPHDLIAKSENIGNTATIQAMEVNQLKDSNRDLQSKIIQLQDELLRLMRELAEAREKAR